MPTLFGLSSAYLLFIVLGLPLAAQDMRDRSVSALLLAAIYACWCLAAFAEGQDRGRIAAAAAVLLVGGLLLFAMPGRLGEADVIFMSGMAAVFSFGHLMIAVALGCAGCLAGFAWMARAGRDGVLSSPMAFLPSLYWGGLTVILGGIRL